MPDVQRQILVVEDDGDIRWLIVQLLDRAGFPCWSAVSVADALEQVERMGMPDLVVTDLHLGERSGRDLQQWFLDDPQRRHVPFLLMSSDRGARRVAREERFAHFVDKGRLASELVSAVRAILEA